jgi:integrase
MELSWNRIERRTLPPTFAKAATDWLNAATPHLAGRTHDIYDVAIRCHLSRHFGQTLLCDINANAVAAYQARRRAQRGSARTINKELQVFRSILKAYKLWLPLQGDVKFEREPASIGRALSHEEEARLLAACESNLMLHTIVTLALNTGLRRNEIRTLSWRQVDLMEKVLTVGKTKTAGGSGRVIPLNRPALAALVRWFGRFPGTKPTDYIFPSCENSRIDCDRFNAQKIDVSQPVKTWRTAWRRALKDSGLQMRFHDLRHCCITKLAESQTSEGIIMGIAGHMSRSMLEHYSHVRLAAKRTALDSIAGDAIGIDCGMDVNQNVHQLSKENSVPSAKPLN